MKSSVMKSRIAGAALAAAAALLLASAGVVGAFDQNVIPYQPGNPLTNGCASGFEALNLVDLAPHGYKAPSQLDDPANGGNGDGIVCGRPFTPQEQAARFPNAAVPVIFDFVDNSLPSVGR
jgi:hypothetical protein